MFLAETLLGVRVWIWLYLLFGVLSFGFIAIYFYRERIRKKYYQIRMPEKLMRVIIHYPSNMYKEYWRIIPDLPYFFLENKKYQFNDDAILKKNDFFSKPEKGKIIIEIEGEKYDLEEMKGIKKRFGYPEIHYFFNVPTPISFTYEDSIIDISSKELEIMSENDLFAKLLTLEDQKKIIIILVAIMIVNAIISAVNLGINMGWIKLE